MSNIHQKAVLALDLGEKRVGVAISHGVAVAPLGWLDYQKRDAFFAELEDIIAGQSISLVIIGLPLGRNGQDTKQSQWARLQAEEIGKRTGLEIKFVEESYSSHEASEFLGRTKNKGEIDAYSAVAIMDRYLNEGAIES